MTTDTSYTTISKSLTAKLMMGTIGIFTLTLASEAFAVSCNFQNGDNFTEICGYIDAGDVQIGGQLNLHVSSTTPHFSVNIKRAGSDDNNLLSSSSFDGAGNYGANSHTQLNWGSAYPISIPSHWTSGIYEVTLNNARGNYPEFVAIKAAQPGSHSKVLVLDSLPTKIAYSPIGGKSFYGFNSSNGRAAQQISMERPTGRGQWTEHRDFASWLDREGIHYEAASMMDLHTDPSLLSHYNLVILVGHNEYWSKEMRDNWDNYLANGGNVAIFSGNTMWWQVRFSQDAKQMICYKNAVSDPLYGIDNSRVTTNWFRQPINRPENLSTGVSFRNGGYHDYTENGIQYYVKNGLNDNGSNGGFTVADASHWIFEGTGLANGSVFGRASGIAGYEVDGALFQMVNNQPVVTGEDGTPLNFQILATTPAYAIDSPFGVPGIVHNNHNGQGWGTLGLFKPSNNSGTVFVAPTIDWAQGLREAPVGRITKNVINRLKSRTSSINVANPADDNQSTGSGVVSTNPANPADDNQSTGSGVASTNPTTSPDNDQSSGNGVVSTNPIDPSNNDQSSGNGVVSTAPPQPVLQASNGGGGSFPSIISLIIPISISLIKIFDNIKQPINKHRKICKKSLN